jgi:hypothetical protein
MKAAPSSVFFTLLFLPGSFKSYQQEAIFVRKDPKPSTCDLSVFTFESSRFSTMLRRPSLQAYLEDKSNSTLLFSYPSNIHVYSERGENDAGKIPCCYLKSLLSEWCDFAFLPAFSNVLWIVVMARRSSSYTDRGIEATLFSPSPIQLPTCFSRHLKSESDYAPCSCLKLV